MTLLPFVLLTDIEQKRAVRVLQALEHVRRRDLVDLVFDLGQKLSVRRHYFPEYSVLGHRQVRRNGRRLMPDNVRERVAPRWSRLPFLRERTHPHDPRGRRARHRRRRCGRRDHRRYERQAFRHCGHRADDTQRRTAALARPRRPHRPRGGRSSRGASPLRGRQACRGREALRAAQLARSAGRRVVQHLAERHRCRADAALRAAPEERGRAAQPRDRPLLGRRGRGGGRVEVRSLTRARHGVRRHRRATCSTRTSPATCRSSFPRRRCRPTSASLPRRRSWRCSSAAPGRARSPIASSTASRCSGSGSSGRPRRVYAAAARAAPKDPEARVAAAVGLFDKARPAQAFSRLGPLSRDVPEGSHRPLPPRPAPALVGPGEGGAAPARARADGRARLAARRHRGPVSGRASQGGYLDAPLALRYLEGFFDGGRVRPLRSQRFDERGQR